MFLPKQQAQIITHQGEVLDEPMGGARLGPEFEDMPNFFANGFLVHNKFVRGFLNKQNINDEKHR